MALCVSNGSGLQRALSASIVLVPCSIFLACPFTAQADTAAQARQAIQAVCDRAAAGYGRRDLSGSMTMFSPVFVLRNVTGRKVNFRQNQASVASAFASDEYSTVAHCTVSEVVPEGNQARAILHWHYITHHSRSASAPAYTIMRDYEERTIWKNPLAAGRR